MGVRRAGARLEGDSFFATILYSLRAVARTGLGDFVGDCFEIGRDCAAFSAGVKVLIYGGYVVGIHMWCGAFACESSGRGV